MPSQLRRSRNGRWAPVVLAALLGVAAAKLPAQQGVAVDSNLVRQILVAEDRRDSTAAAFRIALASPDARVRTIARRALMRISDPKFAGRDSLPPLAPPPVYADPAWRVRYRALKPKPVDCPTLGQALADSAWPVRLRALDLVTNECSSTPVIVAAAKDWSAAIPVNARRANGQPGWQKSAHAIVALARLDPTAARGRLPAFASSPVPWLRTYAARAAGVLGDAATLKRLATDPNDNVKEAAIDALSKVAGHSADDVYEGALSSAGYQAVRAAAIALKGTTDTQRVVSAARKRLDKLKSEDTETAKDARSALTDRLKDLGVVDASPDLTRKPAPLPLPRDAVALALGRDYRLRVRMADSSGGGVFYIRVRGDAAPIMAARVIELARSGWYNGRTWYRVEPDFVIQGGGPGANEYVGHPRFMRDELSAIPQLRGTVGMSTRGHDTGDAQWFINLRDNQRLTRDYTTWAEVVDGIDVVDGILEGDVIARIEVVPAKPHD